MSLQSEILSSANVFIIYPKSLVLEFRLKTSVPKITLRNLWIKKLHSLTGKKSLKRKSGQLC